MSWKLVPILVILLIILYFVPGLQAGFWAVVVILLLIGLMWVRWIFSDPKYYS